MKALRDAWNQQTKNAQTGLLITAIVAASILTGIIVKTVDTQRDDDKPSKKESASESTPDEPAPVPPRELTQADAGTLAARPDDFIGDKIEITGRVFVAPERADGITALQIFTNDDYTDQSMIVYADDTNATDIALDDHVRVTGAIEGKLEGTNGFGADITAPTILATNIEKLTALQAAPKAEASITKPVSQTQNGVKVTIRRVDFALSETRVTMQVSNRSGAKMSIYTTSAKAIQGSRQFEAQYNDTYGELPSEILPGATVFGVVVFPPMKMFGATRFVIDGYSENFYVDQKPFDLTVRARR